MIQKYELTDEKIEFMDKTLYRIRALVDIPKYNVKAGDLGGFVESEKNLSQEGSCWIDNNAKALDNAKVCDDAILCDNAIAFNFARIRDVAIVFGDANVFGGSIVGDNSTVGFNASVYGRSRVEQGSVIEDYAQVYENAIVRHARVQGYSKVHGDAQLLYCLGYDPTTIKDKGEVLGKSIVKPGSVIDGNKYIADTIINDVITCENLEKE